MPTYKYPRPAFAVDCIVFGVAQDKDLQVILVRRGEPPFPGRWALPGGHVEMEETLEAAAMRELEEETGAKISYMEQLYTFGAPDRDPRGRVISTAYLALTRAGDHELKGSSDAIDARWFSVEEIMKDPSFLAFDHADVLTKAVERLRAKVRYAPIGFDLLPKEFTLSDLQGLYEVLLQRPLDKRNFRKRMLRTGLLKTTGKKAKTVPPARTFTFDKAAYSRLTELGFNFEV